MRKFLAILGWLVCLSAFAEVIPPAPKQYFNDYAGVVSTTTAGQLNQTLENFERSTSSQILVAVYPKMQSDSSIEDYTVRVAQSWRVGQKAKDNGAVLFVFAQDHKMFIQVGYGLEGVLPDALCKEIIDREITPRFKAGDITGGLTAGVNAILAAAKGEYKGTGRTNADGTTRGFSWIHLIIFIFVLFLVLKTLRGSGGGLVGSILFNSSGWRSGGGGFSGGGGGGFSGGGGSFGGGGAGGSW